MIYHLSIPCDNPRHVANVLAEIWQGKAYLFPPTEGGYIVFADNNQQGIALEIYPRTTKMIPGQEEVQYSQQQEYSPFNSTHIAISTPLNTQEIENIAHREGWLCLPCDRGPGCFNLIELWVENKFLIELLTPEMISQYVAFMTPKNWEKFLLQNEQLTINNQL